MLPILRMACYCWFVVCLSHVLLFGKQFGDNSMVIAPVKGKYDYHGNDIDCDDSSN